MSSKALIHVKVARHPISDEVIGFRLEAAVPNEAGRVMKARKSSDGQTLGFYATQQTAPSFRRPFLIEVSSDYSELDQKKVDRFKDNLRWQGYREFELTGKYLGRPFANQFE